MLFDYVTVQSLGQDDPVMMQLNKRSAEIYFSTPNWLNSAIPALIENHFEIEQLDWTDKEGFAVQIIVSLLTKLDGDSFIDRVFRIVCPHLIEDELDVPNKETD